MNNTQEPEYIIGGTKVEVGQIWECRNGVQHVISDLEYQGNASLNGMFPIMAGGYPFLVNGRYDPDKLTPYDLIKCVGVVAPLSFFEILKSYADAYAVKADECREKSYTNEHTFEKALFLGEANVYSEFSAMITALLKSKYNEETLQYVLKNLKISVVAPLPDTGITVSPQPDADGWIAWHGGECPVDGDTVVEAVLENGGGSTNTANRFIWNKHKSLHGNNIIAYRVVKPAQSEPEICSITGSEIHSKKKLMLSAEYCHKEIMRIAGEIEYMDKTVSTTWEEAVSSAVIVFSIVNDAIEANPELMEKVK